MNRTPLERFYRARSAMERAACFAILHAGRDADKLCIYLAGSMHCEPEWLAAKARVTIPRKYRPGFQLTIGS